MGIARGHVQGVNDGNHGRGQALVQLVFLVIVEQKTHRAAVHAIDGDAAVHVGVHGLQHQPVAAQSDDGLRLLRRDIAVARGQLPERVRGFLRLAGDKSNFLKAWHRFAAALGPFVGRGHYKAVLHNSCKCLKER